MARLNGWTVMRAFPRFPKSWSGPLAGLVLFLVSVAPDGSAQTMATEPAVKVGLQEGVRRAEVSTSVPGNWFDATGRLVSGSGAMQLWALRAENGRVVLTSRGRDIGVFTSPLRLEAPSEPGRTGLVFAAGHWYRGALEIRARGRALTVVNEVGLEPYLYGVVPAEMSPRWPLEALKAQAVAARTYALAKLGQFQSRGFDLRPNTENQVYSGASVETVASNAAVDGTHGQVLTHGGRVIAAYFHSCSGGFTDSGAAIWGEPRPYLQPVPDYDQASPRYSWQKQISRAGLREGLARQGVQVGDPVRVDVLERSYSGRVLKVRVTGTSGHRDVSGGAIRTAAGLYSTLYSVAPDSFDPRGIPSRFLFAGRGHGHGLGMSQWGARTLASNGYTHLQILAHYYPSAQLSSIPGSTYTP